MPVTFRQCGVRLRGRVLTEEQHQAALDVLPVKPVDDQIKVLLTDEYAVGADQAQRVRCAPHARWTGRADHASA